MTKKTAVLTSNWSFDDIVRDIKFEISHLDLQLLFDCNQNRIIEYNVFVKQGHLTIYDYKVILQFLIHIENRFTGYNDFLTTDYYDSTGLPITFTI